MPAASFALLVTVGSRGVVGAGPSAAADREKLKGGSDAPNDCVPMLFDAPDVSEVWTVGVDGRPNENELTVGTGRAVGSGRTGLGGITAGSRIVASWFWAGLTGSGAGSGWTISAAGISAAVASDELSGERLDARRAP